MKDALSQHLVVQRRRVPRPEFFVFLLAASLFASCQKEDPRPNVPLPKGLLHVTDIYLGANQDSLVRKYHLSQDPSTELWTGVDFQNALQHFSAECGFKGRRLSQLTLVRFLRKGESSDSLAQMLITVTQQSYGPFVHIAEVNMVEYREPVIIWKPADGVVVKVRYTTDATRREHTVGYPAVSFEIQYADTLPAASQHAN